VVQTSPVRWREPPVGISIREYWHAAFLDLFRSMLPEQNGKPFVSYVAHDFLGVSATCIPSPQHKFLQLSRGTAGIAPRAKDRYIGCSRENVREG
ncbi:hypothetical protein IWW34DRAFT_903667, partial [Fusarium oxysporum f. sp. albedinis]